MPDIRVDDILKALGLLGAAIGWIFQMRAKLQREKIKTDLEILEKSKNLYGELDERTKRIEAKVTLLMAYLYRDSVPKTPRYISWGDFALFVLCLVGAVAFTWSWAGSDKYWELALGGLLAFLGIGAFLNAIGKGSPHGADS